MDHSPVSDRGVLVYKDNQQNSMYKTSEDLLQNVIALSHTNEIDKNNLNNINKSQNYSMDAVKNLDNYEQSGGPR